ncbi:beta barrel domain-containing protein, partial [Pasteurella multocida]
MNKDWIKNLKVGDTLYFLETLMRSNIEHEAEVLKIGRKYLTIRVRGRDRKI